jgi:hypothetical protein
MHAVTNPRILIEGDEATGTWYLLDCVTHGQDNPLKVLGVYDETYRRVDGTWRMSSMTLRFKWARTSGTSPRTTRCASSRAPRADRPERGLAAQLVRAAGR